MVNSNRNSVEKSDQQQMKLVCQLCNKSFRCGRSLGGHMRSHVIKPSPFNDNGGILMKNSITESLNGSSNSNDLGYELRKDPKKTQKAVFNGSSNSNDIVVFDKLCKECGKGFQSWKALFGHMKCHSNKILNAKSLISNQDSCISKPENKILGSKICQMKRSRSRNGAIKRSIHPFSTASTITTTTTSITASSLVSDIYDEQEAEIATCLIMLSTDVRKLDKKMKNLKKTNDNQDEFDDQKKRKFECTTCSKSFHSYQAFAGHKACHKKLKGCFDPKSIETAAIKREPMLDHDHMINGCAGKTSDDCQSPSSFNPVGSLKNTKVTGAHECSICSRIFSSGQALGGHKRSHLIAEAKLNQHNMNSNKEFNKPVNEIRGLLDLNMPPDDYVEEEEQETVMMDTNNPWHYNHESTLLGLVSKIQVSGFS